MHGFDFVPTGLLCIDSSVIVSDFKGDFSQCLPLPLSVEGVAHGPLDPLLHPTAS